MARKYAATKSVSGHTILIVDDQLEILTSNKALLENEGHQVLTAVNSDLALKLLRTNRVDLVVVDYFMPRMTGEELIGEIRKIDTHVPTLMQTGYSGEKPPLEMLHSLEIQGYHDKADGPARFLVWVEASLKTAAYLKNLHGAVDDQNGFRPSQACSFDRSM